MAIPDYESIMLPLLKLSGDGKEHRTREATQFISKQFNLSEKEEKKLLPSGTIRVIVNRVGWAATCLKKCQLLESTKQKWLASF